ncbi:MAG: hypothetical protein JNN30_20420 [Rhodanobacteraceae bacterium]|nr:hypothetical protein [Rhodanobacteraceae bacterium]
MSSRLTPEINRQLDTTEEPLGKVVKPLAIGGGIRPLAQRTTLHRT